MPDTASAPAGEFPTIRPLMDAAVAAFGDREAYVDGGQRVSFADWMARADLLAAEFRARGVGRGDVVALMLPASIDYAVAYAAAARLGAITTGLNTRLGRREVESIMAQCTPALVVRDEALGLPGGLAGPAVLSRKELADVYRRPAVKTSETQSAPEDIVTIMWTSGTTGLPKGACLDHRNLSAIAAAAGALSAPGDRRLVTTPFARRLHGQAVGSAGERADDRGQPGDAAAVGHAPPDRRGADHRRRRGPDPVGAHAPPA